jgi:hypothetical protein
MKYERTSFRNTSVIQIYLSICHEKLKRKLSRNSPKINSYTQVKNILMHFSCHNIVTKLTPCVALWFLLKESVQSAVNEVTW